MSKRPHPIHDDGITRGIRVRVTAGRYVGETGVVSDVFRRSSEARSHVHVRGLPSCQYVVASVPLSCVEAVV